MNPGSSFKPLYENLDTTFVNLWSLLRNLSAKNFTGRVRVELRDYSADIFMDGSATPMVHEIDRITGSESREEAVLHRVVLRARETPGTISVFEAANHAMETPVSPANEIPPPPAKSLTTTSPAAGHTAKATAAAVQNHLRAAEVEPSPAVAAESRESSNFDEDVYPTGSYRDWPAILAATGELIGAIARAINAAGEDFDSRFRTTRLQLADDYNFLDPMARNFVYANGVATLHGQVPLTDFVSGLSLALHRTVAQVAVGERARRVRERVALELIAVVRKRREVLERSGFQAQLDRIAGTRVI